LNDLAGLQKTLIAKEDLAKDVARLILGDSSFKSQIITRDSLNDALDRIRVFNRPVRLVSSVDGASALDVSGNTVKLSLDSKGPAIFQEWLIRPAY
jgi:hypothetical protein